MKCPKCGELMIEEHGIGFCQCGHVHKGEEQLERAVAVFYQRNTEKVRGICAACSVRHQLGNKEDELFSSTFELVRLAISEYKETVHSKYQTMDGFVLGVIQANLHRHHLWSLEQREAPEELKADQFELELEPPNGVTQEQIDGFRAGLVRLPIRQRAVLLMSIWGFSSGDIQKVTHENENVVKILKADALEAIKKRVGTEGV